GAELPLHLVDEQRERRFRIGRDVDVGIGHVLEVLQVALDVEAERRDVDRLRVRAARRAAESRASASLHLEVEEDVGGARSIGGVIAILYARTIDSANAGNDAGSSSHFTQSRTIRPMSCALWYELTPLLRVPASRQLPQMMNTGTRSA